MERINEFVTNAQKKLTDFGVQLEQVKKDASEMEQNARNEMNRLIKDIEKKKTEAEYKIGELKSRGENAFVTLKEEVDKSIKSLGESFEKVKGSLIDQ